MTIATFRRSGSLHARSACAYSSRDALERKIIAASSVTRALSVIGDRWTLLILRDAFQGAHRFEEFRNLSGAAWARATSRLNGLENGLLERVRYSDAPPRRYRLTATSRVWRDVVTWRWEHNWAPSGAGIPRYLRHNLCKHAMQPETMLRLRQARRSARHRLRSRAHRRPLPCRYTALSAPVVGERGVIAAPARPSCTSPTSSAIAGRRVCMRGILGLRRFDEIQSGLEIATNPHSPFELPRRPSHPRAPPVLRAAAALRVSLTQKGRDLFPHALMLMVGRSLPARPAARTCACSTSLRRAAQRRGGPPLLQDDRSTRCHLPAGSGRDRCPARRCRGLTTRSLAPRAASKSCFSPIASIIWARS